MRRPELWPGRPEGGPGAVWVGSRGVGWGVGGGVSSLLSSQVGLVRQLDCRARGACLEGGGLGQSAAGCGRAGLDRAIARQALQVVGCFPCLLLGLANEMMLMALSACLASIFDASFGSGSGPGPCFCFFFCCCFACCFACCCCCFACSCGPSSSGTNKTRRWEGECVMRACSPGPAVALLSLIIDRVGWMRLSHLCSSPDNCLLGGAAEASGASPGTSCAGPAAPRLEAPQPMIGAVELEAAARPGPGGTVLCWCLCPGCGSACGVVRLRPSVEMDWDMLAIVACASRMLQPEAPSQRMGTQGGRWTPALRQGCRSRVNSLHAPRLHRKVCVARAHFLHASAGTAPPGRCTRLATPRAERAARHSQTALQHTRVRAASPCSACSASNCHRQGCSRPCRSSWALARGEHRGAAAAGWAVSAAAARQRWSPGRACLLAGATVEQRSGRPTASSTRRGAAAKFSGSTVAQRLRARSRKACPVFASAVATKTVKIGTRGSPLALAQAYMTRDLLKVGRPLPTRNSMPRAGPPLALRAHASDTGAVGWLPRAGRRGRPGDCHH
jgi:hypothetical protein